MFDHLTNNSFQQSAGNDSAVGLLENSAARLIGGHFGLFRPEPPLRELMLLTAIQNDERTSQQRLAGAIGVSVAMANSYVRQALKSGYISVSGPTHKSLRYSLTADGKRRQLELLLRWAVDVTQLYASARGDLATRLRQQMELHQVSSAVLFGAGDTGQVLYHASAEAGLRIVGVVDSDHEKIGMTFGSLIVKAPETIPNYDAEAILVASFARSSEIRATVSNLAAKKLKVLEL